MSSPMNSNSWKFQFWILVLGGVMVSQLAALTTAAAGLSLYTTTKITVPNRSQPWYLGHGVNIAPFTIHFNPKRLVEGHEYKIGLYVDGSFRDKKVTDISYDLQSLVTTNGKLAANFDATDEAQFQQPDFPSYASFIADKIKDGDDYKVKFTRTNRRWFDKTLAKSHKFRIFRIGGQPKVPNGYRFIAEISIPTVLGPQTVPALDKETMKSIRHREQLQFNVEVAQRIPKGKLLTFTLVDAIDGRPTTARVVLKMDTAKDPKSILSGAFPLHDVKPGSYFIEVKARTGWRSVWTFKKMIFRSAPFNVVLHGGAPTVTKLDSPGVQTLEDATPEELNAFMAASGDDQQEEEADGDEQDANQDEFLLDNAPYNQDEFALDNAPYNPDGFLLDNAPYNRDQEIVRGQVGTSAEDQSLEEELAALEREQLTAEGKKPVDSIRYKRTVDADSVDSLQSKRTRRLSSSSRKQGSIVEPMGKIYEDDIPLASTRRYTIKYDPMDTDKAATAAVDQEETEDEPEEETEYEQVAPKFSRPTLQISPPPSQLKRVRKDVTQQPTGEF